jgi:uncharacterized protein YcnI
MNKNLLFLLFEPKLVLSKTFLFFILVSASLASIAQTPFTPGNIVVVRVGDGVSTLSFESARINLVEMTTTGTVVQTIPLPYSAATVTGSNNKICVQGSSSNEGNLTLSGDGNYFVLSGYNSDEGVSQISTAANVKRVICRIAMDGTWDTKTLMDITNSTGNTRCAATNDGTGFWLVGSTLGVRYTPYASTGAAGTTTVVSNTATNLRSIQAFGGNLIVGITSGTVRAGTISAFPTTTGNTIVGFTGVSSTITPTGIYMTHLPGGPSGLNTMYIANDNQPNAPLEKYCFNSTTNNWDLMGAMGTGAYKSLTGSTSGSNVTLFFTGGTSTMRTMVDNTGFNQAPSGWTETTVSTVTSGIMAYRGVQFVQGTTPTLTTTGTPTAFTACSGTASAQQSFTVSGSNLTNNITITAPTGFEVSTTSGFGSSVTLTQSGGSVANTTINVRMASTAAGTPSGDVTVTSTGATTQNVAVSGTVNALPVPNPSSDSPKNVGTTLTFSSASGMSSYIWSGPNSFTSSMQAPSISNVTSAAQGVYTLTVTNVNNCTASATTNVVVNPVCTPPTGAMASSNSPVAVGLPLNLTSSATGGASYTWTGPNGFTSSVQNPRVTPSAVTMTGVYTVTIASSSGSNCTVTATTAVCIAPRVISGPTINHSRCEGGAITWTSSFNGADPNLNYQWKRGTTNVGTNSSSLVLTNLTAADAGAYTITGTNSCGSASYGPINLTIVPAPTSAMAGSNSPIEAGAALNLTSSATGGTSYAWAGPNGFTSAMQNPTVSTAATAAMSGVYTVTIGNSASCTATATTNVVVNSTSASSNSPVCAGSTLNLQEGAAPSFTGFEGNSYSWAGPNSFSSSLQNPSISNVTSAAQGIYTLTITRPGGFTGTATTEVTVNALPVPNPSSNSPIDAGNTLTFSSASDMSSYIWRGPNSFTSSIQAPSISNVTSAAQGVYTLTVTNANNCTASATTNVVVNPICTPPTLATANSNSPVSVTTPLNLTSSATGGVSYTWAGPNGFTSAVQNPRVTPSAVTMTGVYTVTIASSSGSNCTVTATTAVCIAPRVISGPTINHSRCEGGAITWTSSFNGADPNLNYQWKRGTTNVGTNSSSLVLTNLTAADAGAYTITGTNSCGSASYGPINLTVNASPVPNPSSNSPVCAGSTLNLQEGAGGIMNLRESTFNFSGTASYSWTGPNSFSSTVQNPSVLNATAAAQGTYTLTVTNPNGCSATATTAVVINSPIPAFASSNSPVCAGSTLNLQEGTLQLSGLAANSYNWAGPNSFTSSSRNPSISNVTTAANGTYTLTITSSRGCTSTATTVVVVNPLSVSATNTGPYTANQTIQLVGTGGNTYSWAGPDGFTATGAIVNRPNATLSMSGTYTATITNGLCSNTATTNVIVTGIDPCVQVIEYTYVKAGNPYEPLFTLTDGMVIAQQDFPTSILARPICNSINFGSIYFYLESDIGIFLGIVQNVQPYSLFDNSGQNVFGRALPPGNYRLSTIGYSGINRQGTIIYPETFINFTIQGTMAMVDMPTYTGGEFCAGSTVPVTFTTSGTFNVGNQFKIQLSDKDGNFTNTIEIGSAASAGTVNCTIPLSIPYGENYRIRVISTNATAQNMNPSAVIIHPYIANLISPMDDYSTDKNRKAVYQLDAINKVNSPAKVNYQAGNSIQLNAGFEAKAGAVFEAKIGACNF